jgi:hypothetical protein
MKTDDKYITRKGGISIVAMVLLSPFMNSCFDNSDLCPEDVPDAPSVKNVPVQVVIHWDGIDVRKKPEEGMAVQLFHLENKWLALQVNLPVDGGKMMVPVKIPYFALCYDYYGNDYINFRHEEELGRFEAYSTTSTGLYNTYGPGAGENERTVSEPIPYNFFVTHNDEPFIAKASTADTVQLLHFYPQDVTREFTFLIVDVKGAKNITGAHGAVSGMAYAYRIAEGVNNPAPATVLFGNQTGRVQWKVNAQQIKWTQTMLDGIFNGNALLSDWPDKWDNPDTGWTGDWIMGSFCTFGPADIRNIRNRLTVEVLSSGMGYYHAAWGGGYEDTVREQIAGALGQNGTRGEQLAWRQQNGGFDIILYNEDRLDVPEGKPVHGDGGIHVDSDGFDNVNIPLGTREQTSR